MRTLTIEIDNDQDIPKLLEFLKPLNIRVKEMQDSEPTKAEILVGIKDALKEVKLIQADKKETVSLKDFLKEF